MDAVAASYVCFPLPPGKKDPPPKGWQTIPLGAHPPEGQFGHTLTAADLIVDADPRRYPEGRDVLAELLAAWPLVLPTRCVQTPQGGWHIYTKKDPGVSVKVEQSAWPGIDFLSAGHYVVGAGSRTEHGQYVLVTDLPVKEVPAEFLASLEPPATPALNGVVAPDLLMSQRYEAECNTSQVAVEGRFGDNTTFQLACRGRDLGLPPEETYRCMRDFWNARCKPPWQEHELWKKVLNAYNYGQNALGAFSPTAVFSGFVDNVVQIDSYQAEQQREEIFPTQPDCDQHGAYKNTTRNIVYLLRSDPYWRKMLKFNQFSGALEFATRPWWRDSQLNCTTEVQDQDWAAMRTWFSTARGLEVAKDKLFDASLAAATRHHPPRDWLDSLEWDGVPRLDRLLIDTAGATDTRAHRAFSKCLGIAMVKRIYEPGCKQDYVVVLESRQGHNKSIWVEELGRPWSSVGDLVQGEKDTYIKLRGKWVVELPEFNAALSKQDFNWLKGVITTNSDTYRPPYGRSAIDVPRESIFIATINPNANWQYLKDDENRRYWPVKTGQFDVEALKRNRTQYFAEAVFRYRQGEVAWITDPQVQAEVKLLQDSRRECDPWLELITGWALANSARPFNLLEVCEALQLQASRINARDRARIYEALHSLGFEYDRGSRPPVWSKAPSWRSLF